MRTYAAYAVFDDVLGSPMTLCRLMRRLQSNADATRFRVGRFLGLGYRTFLTQLSHAGATRPCVCVCVCRAAVGLRVDLGVSVRLCPRSLPLIRTQFRMSHFGSL